MESNICRDENSLYEKELEIFGIENVFFTANENDIWFLFVKR